MTETRFQIENWREYYKAELDEEDLDDQINRWSEGSLSSFSLDGDKLVTKVASELECVFMLEYVDDESGFDGEIETEVDGNLTYTAEYKVNSDHFVDGVDEVEKALNDAIESGQSTFEVKVLAESVSVSDVLIEADRIECYDIDEYDERKMLELAIKDVENGLNHASYQAHAGDSFQPPSDKELTFICTIPAE